MFYKCVILRVSSMAALSSRCVCVRNCWLLLDEINSQQRVAFWYSLAANLASALWPVQQQSAHRTPTGTIWPANPRCKFGTACLANVGAVASGFSSVCHLLHLHENSLAKRFTFERFTGKRFTCERFTSLAVPSRNDGCTPRFRSVNLLI